MYASTLSFPGTLFGNFDRLHRELDSVFFDTAAAQTRTRAGGTPALNIGLTPASVEIQAYVPGIDPAKVELVLDRGVLTLSGERVVARPEGARAGTRERRGGAFRRAVHLPEDADAQRVSATYKDGVLRISVGRRAAAQPQRIDIQ